MTRRALLLLVGLAAGTAAAQSPPPERARLDSVFAAFQGTSRAGCAVGIVKDGQLVEARGYGMAELSQQLAITPGSVFHVASVSKEFTAMSLVLLAQSGRISLDDDVRKYLPELPDYGHTITIRHLLTHTSGIRDQWNLLMQAGWRLGEDLITEGDVMEIVPGQKKLNFVPSTDWLYSNSGFTLAAVIVKRVTGLSLRQYADREIFGPLGMTSTHFHDDNTMIVARRARGYAQRDGEWREMVPNYSTVGATSLFTTVEDLARWHRQLDLQELGGRAAWSELLRPGVLVNGDTLRYALGIAHGAYRGLATISHSGGDPGYRAHVLHFPAQRFGVSVLCNDVGANAARLAEQASEVYLGGQMQPVDSAAAAGPSDPLASAVGVYWSDSAEAVARLMLNGQRLVWGTGPNAPALILLGDGRYRVGAGPAVLRAAAGGSLVMIGGQGETSRYAPVTEWTPAAAEKSALVGRYSSEELGTSWEIRLGGDTLSLRRRKFPPAVMTPLFRDAYRASGFLDLIVRVERSPKGQVTGLLVGSGRVRRLEFKREP